MRVYKLCVKRDMLLENDMKDVYDMLEIMLAFADDVVSASIVSSAGVVLDVVDDLDDFDDECMYDDITFTSESLESLQAVSKIFETDYFAKLNDLIYCGSGGLITLSKTLIKI